MFMQAGVRSLSRNLAAICRHVAVQIVSQQDGADSACSPEQQESQYSSTHDSTPVQDLSHPSNQAQQQQHQRSRADEDSGALDQDLESGTTAPPGGFFWGSLWGGLKGAFTPPRHHPSGSKRHHHVTADHQPDPGSRHSSPVHMSPAHADQADIPLRQNSQQWHRPGAQPEGSLALPADFPGRTGLPACTGRLTEPQEESSNPFGGLNSDMSKPSGSEMPMLTVTAELVEEVLGPRKYNESDSADSLASPGDFV